MKTKKQFTAIYVAAFLIVNFHLSIINCFAQTPPYHWAKGAGGTGNERGNSCSADTNGNIILTGCFSSDSITFGATVLTNAGIYDDMFIVKYDINGNVLWAKSAGGTGGDVGNNCSTDANGNIIVTGYFTSSSITFGTTVLTNAGDFEMFIVKYDPNGNVLWATRAGGTNNDIGYSCSTDTNGNIIATGVFYSDSITFGTAVLTNAGLSDMFIVKYDPNGNVLWAKSAGGTSDDYGWSCSTDANGNIIVAGFFESSSVTFGTTVLTNAGNNDMFIVKCDPIGNVLWATSAGGTGSDFGNSCSTDANGNIIATGHFTNSSITFGTTVLTNAGDFEMFIVKYDPNGNVLWAKSAGGADFDAGNSCSTDAVGNIIATGCFESSSITFGTTVLTNAGNRDIFIVKYDINGNVLWANSTGGTNDDRGNSCSPDANGNIIATGNFGSSSVAFGTTTVTNVGGDDMFIVKLSGGATGIEETNFLNFQSVYPNPSSGKFQIVVNQFLITGVEIYNSVGENVYQNNIKQQTPYEINFANQPRGVYFIKVHNEEKYFTRKIIIE